MPDKPCSIGKAIREIIEHGGLTGIERTVHIAGAAMATGNRYGSRSLIRCLAGITSARNGSREC
jgi:hypothetical protein